MRRTKREVDVRWNGPGDAFALAAIAALVVATSVRGQSNPWNSQPPNPYQQAAFNDATSGDDGARFRAYKLHQIDADTAQRHLTQYFAATPGIEIVADTPRNRVLVRGNPQILAQAGELLAKLDPPPTNAQPALPPRPPAQRLEAYALTPTTRNILAALQNQAAGRPDVRVAVDARTSQALVLAPDTVHTQIREKLAQSVQNQQTDPTLAENNPQTSGPQSSTLDRQFQLRNLHADDLRQRLERLLSRPLPASTDGSGQWQSFEIEAVPGAGVTATINPTTGELHLSGPADRTDAWRQVIEALDSGPIAEGTVTQLVATKPASHDRVRQVLQVVQSQNGGQTNMAPSLVAALMQQQATPVRPAARVSRHSRGRGRPGSLRRRTNGDRRGQPGAGGRRTARAGADRICRRARRDRAPRQRARRAAGDGDHQPDRTAQRGDRADRGSLRTEKRRQPGARRVVVAALPAGARSADRRREHHAAGEAERAAAGRPAGKRADGDRAGPAARPAGGARRRGSRCFRSSTPSAADAKTMIDEFLEQGEAAEATGGAAAKRRRSRRGRWSWPTCARIR